MNGLIQYWLCCVNRLIQAVTVMSEQAHSVLAVLCEQAHSVLAVLCEQAHSSNSAVV